MGPNLISQKSMGDIDLSSGVSNAVFVTLAPVRILQVGVITKTETTGTPIVRFFVTEADETAASPASPGDGTITIPAGAANRGFYIDVEELVGSRIVYPGEAWSATPSPTGVGTVEVFALYEILGLNDAGSRNHVSGHTGSTTNPTSLASLTKVVA